MRWGEVRCKWRPWSARRGGRGLHVRRFQLHRRLSLVCGPDSLSSLTRPLSTPWLPSPPTCSAPTENTRGSQENGPHEPHFPYWGHVAQTGGGPRHLDQLFSATPEKLPAITSPPSLKCKELWNQTAPSSNPAVPLPSWTQPKP